MKKIIVLSLFFTGSVLCRTADPIPAPAVNMQTLNSVQSISGYLLQYLMLLLYRLAALQAEDREVIRGAFLIEAQKTGYFPQSYDDCNALAIKIIKAKVFNEVGYEASKHLSEPGPTKIANSISRNVELELNKNGIHGFTLIPYMGDKLHHQTRVAVGNSEYDRYRR